MFEPSQTFGKLAKCSEYTVGLATVIQYHFVGLDNHYIPSECQLSPALCNFLTTHPHILPCLDSDKSPFLLAIKRSLGENKDFFLKCPPNSSTT